MLSASRLLTQTAFLTAILSATAGFGQEVQSDAGCYIRKGDRVLMVLDVWSKRYGLPGGMFIQNETPQETARRETAEETGLKVEVRGLLAKTPQGFSIFECVPSATVAMIDETRVHIPQSAWAEVREAAFVNLAALEQKELRFPGQTPLLLKLFDQVQSQTSELFQIERPSSNALEDAELAFIRALQLMKTPVMNLFFKLSTKLGEEGFMVFVLALVFVLVSRRIGFEGMLVLCLSSLLNNILKNIFCFVRPSFYDPLLDLAKNVNYGFPSGHTMATAGLWVFLALRLTYPWRWKVTALIIALVGLSRMYLGAHFPHDIIGGVAFGGLTAWIYHRYFTEEALSQNRLILKWGLIYAIAAGALAIYFTPHPVAISCVIFGLVIGNQIHAYVPLLHLRTSVWNQARPEIRVVFVLGGFGAIWVIAKLLSPVEGTFLACFTHHCLKYLALGAWTGLQSGPDLKENTESVLVSRQAVLTT